MQDERTMENKKYFIYSKKFDKNKYCVVRKKQIHFIRVT